MTTDVSSGPPMTVERLNRVVGYALTPAQLDVVTAPLEPTLVVAGAGSGKTTVMAARVVWLVGTGQVAPGEVLGLTFTNKAAGELAARVRLMLRRAGLLDRLPAGPGGGGAPGAADAADGEPAVSTYHAYAGRLLREHGLRIGVEPGARLLADATRFQVATRVVARFDGPLRLQSTHLPTVVADVLALDAELAEHLVELDAARAHDRATLRSAEEWLDAHATSTKRSRADTVRLRDTCAKRLELLDLVADLRAERARHDLVDFSDQLRLAAELVRSSDRVVEAERALYKVVLLDEYQDTSVAQRVLLQTTFGDGHPVTAVGDPCQAIYGWRGASVHNIDAFPRDFPAADGRPAQLRTLAVNNRSGDAVLRLANRLAEPLRTVHPAVAPLAPRPDLVGTARVMTALHASHHDEVTWVSDAVARLVHVEGRRPDDVAVLVRVGAEAVHYRDALIARGVPVEVVGLGGLLDVPEVADVVATLQVLDDPTANPALVRLLSGPRWRIGPRDLALLGRRAAELAGGPASRGLGAEDAADDQERLRAALSEAVAEVDPAEVVSLPDAVEDPGRLPYSPEARDRFAAFAAELRALRRHQGEPVAEIVARVVSITGLDVEVAARQHGDGGAALAQIAEEAARFSDPDGESGLHAFLAYLHAARSHDSGLEPPPILAPSAVRLMTAHKAKGLEFPVVFVPALSDGVFPSDKPRPTWTRQARCVPGPLRGDAADRPSLAGLAAADHVAYKAAEKVDAELEERRLAYVAATRAEELLVLSGHWWGPTQVKPRGPSAYLLEAVELCRRADDPAFVVAVEAPEPESGSTNPAQVDGAPVPWPAPLDADSLARRREVAAAVRARAAARRAGGAPPPATPTGLSAADAAVVESWDRDAAALLTEARLLAGATAEVVPVPSSLAATAAVRLMRDPARVAADLVRPMPRPPAPAARRGTRFHEWVEEHFGRRQLELADLAAGVAGGSGRLGDLDEPDGVGAGLGRPVAEHELDDLVAAFLAGPFADRVPHRVEAPFSVVVGGLVLRGRIDAVYAEPDGGWLVVDWKTGRGEVDPLQLALYRLAWAELVGVDVEQVRAAFYVVPTGAVEEPDGLPDRVGLETIVTGLAAGE